MQLLTSKNRSAIIFYYISVQKKGSKYMKQDMIVILDLGSTENAAVARQIRDLGVYSEIYAHDITLEELKALNNVKGIILNGGENRVVDGVEVEVRPELYDCGYPMISIDYPQSKCETKYTFIHNHMSFLS